MGSTARTAVGSTVGAAIRSTVGAAVDSTIGAGIASAISAGRRARAQTGELEVVHPRARRSGRHAGEAGRGPGRGAAVGDGEPRRAVHRGGERHRRRTRGAEAERGPLAEVADAARHVAQHGRAAAAPAADLEPAGGGDCEVVAVTRRRRAAPQRERNLGAESDHARVDAAVGAGDVLHVGLVEAVLVGVGARVGDVGAGRHRPARPESGRVVAVEVVGEEHSAGRSSVRASVGPAAVGRARIRTRVRRPRIRRASVRYSRVRAARVRAGVRRAAVGSAIAASAAAAGGERRQREIVEPGARYPRGEPGAAGREERLRGSVGHREPQRAVHAAGQRHGSRALRGEGEAGPFTQVGNAAHHVAQHGRGAAPPTADLQPPAGEHHQIVAVAGGFTERESRFRPAEPDCLGIDAAIGAGDPLRRRAIERVQVRVGPRIGDPRACQHGPIGAQAGRIAPVEVVREQHGSRWRRATRTAVGAAIRPRTAIGTTVGAAPGGGVGSGAVHQRRDAAAVRIGRLAEHARHVDGGAGQGFRSRGIAFEPGASVERRGGADRSGVHRAVEEPVVGVGRDHVAVEDDQIASQPRHGWLQRPVGGAVQLRRPAPARAVEEAVVETLVEVLVDEMQAAGAVGHRAERGAVIDAVAERVDGAAPARQRIGVVAQPHAARVAAAVRAVEEHQPRPQADQTAAGAVGQGGERWLLGERSAAVGADADHGGRGAAGVETERLYPDATQGVDGDEAARIGGRVGGGVEHQHRRRGGPVPIPVVSPPLEIHVVPGGAIEDRAFVRVDERDVVAGGEQVRGVALARVVLNRRVIGPARPAVVAAQEPQAVPVGAVLLQGEQPGRRASPAGIHPHQVPRGGKRERVSVVDRRDHSGQQDRHRDRDHSAAPSKKSASNGNLWTIAALGT